MLPSTWVASSERPRSLIGIRNQIGWDTSIGPDLPSHFVDKVHFVLKDDGDFENERLRVCCSYGCLVLKFQLLCCQRRWMIKLTDADRQLCTQSWSLQRWLLAHSKQHSKRWTGCMQLRLYTCNSLRLSPQHVSSTIYTDFLHCGLHQYICGSSLAVTSGVSATKVKIICSNIWSYEAITWSKLQSSTSLCICLRLYRMIWLQSSYQSKEKMLSSSAERKGLVKIPWAGNTTFSQHQLAEI